MSIDTPLVLGPSLTPHLNPRLSAALLSSHHWACQQEPSPQKVLFLPLDLWQPSLNPQSPSLCTHLNPILPIIQSPAQAAERKWKWSHSVMSDFLRKDLGCFSGCLMSSAGIQKLFCGIYLAFKCSFDEFVGEKVFSLSYSSAIFKFYSICMYKFNWITLL